MTQNPEPKVTLISHTIMPIETVFVLWKSSKDDEPLMDVSDVDFVEAIGLFKKIIAQNIPVSEHLNFVFMLEHVSVSFREQMVRHRIGVNVDDKIGVDIIPDLADSSWWSQSMRILDMGHFSRNRNYRLPKSIKTETGKQIFENTMTKIEDAYNTLVGMNIPMEDARELIPLGTHHRISWSLNLSAIQHIVGKRCCWILQAGLWFPIIIGMISELVEVVDPVFRNLANPPCIRNNCFAECVYHLENERRADKLDAHSPCPLWLHNHFRGATEVFEKESGYLEREREYELFWGRNTRTGEII